MKMHNARKPRMKGRHRPNVPQENFGNLAIDIDKIDSRCRHNVQYIRQFVDKFNNLAREMLSSGDRVAAEGFHQHADHYQRLLNERLHDRMMQERTATEKVQRETMEGQNESRNVYPIDATSTTISAAKSDGKSAPAADSVACAEGVATAI
jgi:hypothetical protein